MKLPIKTTLSALVMCLAACLTPQQADAQTLDKIRQAGSIKIGYPADEAPFSWEDGAGKPVGYTILLAEQIVRSLQAGNDGKELKIQYVKTDIATGLDKVASGEIDILCAASTITLERLKKVSFSLPIYNGGIGVLLRKDASPALYRVLSAQPAHEGPVWRATVNRGLINSNIAVHKGTVTEKWVRDQVALLGAQVHIVEVATHEEGVQLVKDKKADAYFGDRVILETAVKAAGENSGLGVLDRSFNFESIALAIPRNDDDFRLAVDTALAGFYQQDDFWKSYEQYFGQPGDTAKLLFSIYSLK